MSRVTCHTFVSPGTRSCAGVGVLTATKDTGEREVAFGVPALIPLLLHFCVNKDCSSGALSVSWTIPMSCRFLCLVWIYFKSCSLHGKISVQSNKGYFLCHVSGSWVLSVTKVECYELHKAKEGDCNQPPAGEEELLVLVVHLSPK